MGFTFDDTDKKGVASPLAEMRVLIEKDPRNRQAIFPYIGGEEVNTNPTHAHHRYVINFRDWPLRREEVGESRADVGGSWEGAGELREGVGGSRQGPGNQRSLGGHGRARATSGAGIHRTGKTVGNQRILRSHGREWSISGTGIRYVGKTAGNQQTLATDRAARLPPCPRPSSPRAPAPRTRRCLALPAQADMQRYFVVAAPSVHQMVLGLERRVLLRRRAGRARSLEVLVAPEAFPVLR